MTSLKKIHTGLKAGKNSGTLLEDLSTFNCSSNRSCHKITIKALSSRELVLGYYDSRGATSYETVTALCFTYIAHLVYANYNLSLGQYLFRPNQCMNDHRVMIPNSQPFIFINETVRTAVFSFLRIGYNNIISYSLSVVMTSVFPSAVCHRL
jgi:hypothetical protein